MRHARALLSAFTLSTLTTGCATITRGTTEVLVVESEPPGANVTISPEGRNCKTPCSVELKRKRDYQLDVERHGYEPVRVNVMSEVAGAGAAGMAGNVLLGGLIGAGVDAATGATKKLTPNPVRVNLVKLPEAVSAPTAPAALAPAPSTTVATPSADSPSSVSPAAPHTSAPGSAESSP